MADAIINPESARLQSLEREILTLKVSQHLSERKFVSDRARQDFQQLILRSLTVTPDGVYGPGAAPLEKYIAKEYEARRGLYSPLPAAAAPVPAAKKTVYLEDISPRASRATLDAAWEAIREAWPVTK